MTRSPLVPILLVSTFAVASCAQGPSPQGSSAPATVAPAAAPQPTENVEAVITQLERDWVAAIVKKDTATLDRLLAQEFNGTSPTTHTYPRETAIGDIKSGRYVVDSMDLDEISVNSYGTTAVAFTSQEEKSRYDGKNTSGHYHFTDVWVKKDGQWQAVASHGTRYDKGH